jgi:hypothetical protein
MHVKGQGVKVCPCMSGSAFAFVSREPVHGVYPKSDNRRRITAKTRKPVLLDLSFAFPNSLPIALVLPHKK